MGKGGYFGSEFKRPSTRARKSRAQNLEAAAHIAPAG